MKRKPPLKENYKAFLKYVNYVIIYHLGIYKNNLDNHLMYTLMLKCKILLM